MTHKRISIPGKLVLAVLTLMFPLFLQAQLNAWVGSNYDGNWSLNAVPTLTHDVVIPNGSTVIISVGLSGEASILTIDLNVLFTVDGVLTVEN
ncbi:MAG: hypothetical protein OEQ53_12575 [Saprospiraceae bacterium]|nr:hypothetical protein [Saprospiraceae bacterium]